MKITRIVTNNNLKFYKQNTNFKAKSIEDRMNEYKKKQDWWDWHINGGKEAARNAAITSLDNECAEAERSAVKARQNANSFYNSSQKKLQAQEAIINEKENILSSLRDEYYENVLAIANLEEQIANNKSTADYNHYQIQNLKEEQVELAEKSKEVQKELKNLKNKLKSTQNKANRHVRQQLSKVSNELKAERNSNIKNAENVYDTADGIMDDLLRFAHTKNNDINSIKGYRSVKDELQRILGTPLEKEKNGVKTIIPNGVLLYGPQGCGKTVLARTFAERTGCNIAYFKPTINTDKAYNNLVDIINTAKDNYSKNKNRTIILIDEFDSFAPINTEKSEQMKNLTDKISENSYCSIIATTNFPENIDITLLRDGRFEKIAIGPANNNDLEEILQHYLKKSFPKLMNLSELIYELSQNPNGKYSNALIKNTIDNFIKSSLYTNTSITYNNLVKSFKETVPDITQKALQRFELQIKYVKKI